jgi:hypothetical protein
MDELFRQAAQDYPLNTDSGNWNAVFDKMQKGNNKQKAGKGKYFFLLLLIPIGILCTTYITNDTFSVNNTTKATETKNTTSGNETTGNDRLENTGTATEISDNLKNDRHEPVTPTVELPTGLSFERKLNGNDVDDVHRGINMSLPKVVATVISDKKNLNEGSFSGADNVNRSPSVDNNASEGNSSAPFSTNQNNNAPEIPTTEINTEEKAITEKLKEKSEVTTNSKSKEKKEKEPKTKTSKIYFGFQIGPDFSMVKSVKIDGTGYSTGLLLGYNINKKFAIETGLLWDHKRYRAEGRHFSTEKLNWPHVDVLDVSGFCNMYEIPINLRYNFSRTSKQTVFATAGVSSYLMKKENYDYNYIRYGTYSYGNKEYKNTTNNWLSVAHVSIGLQKKLGVVGDLRVEPYIKLPLHGVGIGNMSLRSTGVYLGITRPIR